MKKLIVFLLYCFSLFFNHTTIAQTGGLKLVSTNFQGVEYPKFDAQNRVQFSFHAPISQNVQLNMLAPVTGVCNSSHLCFLTGCFQYIAIEN